MGEVAQGVSVGVRQDMIDFRVAIKRRYEITDEMKQTMLNVISGIMSDPLASKREIVSACKVLIAAEQQNQTDERVFNDNARILEFAERLGIGEEVEAASQRPPDRIACIDAAGQAAGEL